MSVRSDLIESVRLLFTVSSLGITSASYVMRRVNPTELDFTQFPLTHILAPDEQIKHSPGRELNPELTVETRVFYNNPTSIEIESLISNLKIITSSWSPSGANWSRLSSVVVRSEQQTKFVEVAFIFRISYWTPDNQP